MNPRPCGYFQSDTKPCTCASATVTKYQKRISGTLLDRIDIHIVVPRVDYEKLSGDRLGGKVGSNSKASSSCQKPSTHPFLEYRIIGYRLQCRYARGGDMTVLPVAERGSEFDAGGDESHESLGARVSPHLFDKLTASLKLARKIADLAACEEIQSTHLAEALQYRPKLMMG